MKHRLLIVLLLQIAFCCFIDALFAQVAEEQANVAQPLTSAPIRVALFKDRGVSDMYKKDVVILEQDGAFEVKLVTGQEIRDGILEQFDIVFFPGGMCSTQQESLGEEGLKKLKSFIRSGKGYLGVSAGAYLAIKNKYINAQLKSDQWARGETNLKIAFSDLGLKLVGDKFQGEQDIYYRNGPVVTINETLNMPRCEVLAWFKTETAQNGTPAGIQVDSPAILLSACGRGTVVVFSPYPECTPNMNALLPTLLHHIADNLRFGKTAEAAIRTDVAAQPSPTVLPAVEYIRSMAEIEWIPPEDITWFNPGKGVMFKAGEVYKGLPYTQGGRYTNFEQFKELLIVEDGKPVYKGPVKPSLYRGTDCSSSCSYSWRNTIPWLPILKTWHMEPGDYCIINPQTGKTEPVFKKVGDYKFTDFHKSVQVIEENGRDVMSRCYDQLLPGDAIVKRPHGHVCMVCRVDKEKRLIYVTEQAGLHPDDRSKLLEDHQTWRVEYPYSYDDRMDQGYLPITINERILP